MNPMQASLPIEHLPHCKPRSPQGCTCGAQNAADALGARVQAPHEDWCVTCDCGALEGPGQGAGGAPKAHAAPRLPSDAATPLARLLALIGAELQAVHVNQGAGNLFRVTCVRTRGAPLTTLDRDLNTAVRLAVEELSQ